MVWYNPFTWGKKRKIKIVHQVRRIAWRPREEGWAEWRTRHSFANHFLRQGSGIGLTTAQYRFIFDLISVLKIKSKTGLLDRLRYYNDQWPTREPELRKVVRRNPPLKRTGKVYKAGLTPLITLLEVKLPEVTATSTPRSPPPKSLREALDRIPRWRPPGSP